MPVKSRKSKFCPFVQLVRLSHRPDWVLSAIGASRTVKERVKYHKVHQMAENRLLCTIYGRPPVLQEFLSPFWRGGGNECLAMGHDLNVPLAFLRFTPSTAQSEC